MNPLAHPHAHSFDRRTKSKDWSAQTNWDLPANHRLKIHTGKDYRGMLSTTASVCTYQDRDGYSSETHTLGLGGGGDLYIQLRSVKARVTEKMVAAQHADAIRDHFDTILERIAKQYGYAMGLPGAPRPLKLIAKDIYADWKSPYFGAVPYLEAIDRLNHVDDKFGEEDGRTQVIYLLSNMTTWKGEVARRIKAELQELLK